ncbi:hypothetical protein TNCV_859901 [Trichonephila clavipes]|nr:hypothetical protein TNCV_859901 [Trichonephila clavipes]
MFTVPCIQSESNLLALSQAKKLFKTYHPDEKHKPRLPDSIAQPITNMPLSRMENTTFAKPSITDSHDMGLRTVYSPDAQKKTPNYMGHPIHCIYFYVLSGSQLSFRQIDKFRQTISTCRHYGKKPLSPIQALLRENVNGDTMLAPACTLKNKFIQERFVSWLVTHTKKIHQNRFNRKRQKNGGFNTLQRECTMRYDRALRRTSSV